MWDLRNSVSPLKEFVGHGKGVLGLAWSHHDSALLLSSAKDHRTVCWDVHTGEPLCELLASGSWAHDVQWCPSQPGVFSAASFDGCVELHAVTGCTGGRVTEVINADLSVSTTASGDAAPLRRAPAWMKRPAGASFGFGGRLVSFANKVWRRERGWGSFGFGGRLVPFANDVQRREAGWGGKQGGAGSVCGKCVQGFHAWVSSRHLRRGG
eukprot:339448-Chlamydomonas_euryale.AAC.1